MSDDYNNSKKSETTEEHYNTQQVKSVAKLAEKALHMAPPTFAASAEEEHYNSTVDRALNKAVGEAGGTGAEHAHAMTAVLVELLQKFHNPHVDNLWKLRAKHPTQCADGSKPLNKDYFMELHDPKHRLGEVLMKIFDNKYKDDIKITQPFFQWLNEMDYFEVSKMLTEIGGAAYARNNAPAFMKGVKYMDDATRANYSVTIANGLIEWQGKPLDTDKLETVFSGGGWGMWVLSPDQDQTMYTNSHIRGLSHHSGFLQGAPVKGAGEWLVKDGRLVMISGKSGHYQCDLPSLCSSLRLLQSKGIDLAPVKVCLWKSRKEPVAVPALELLNNKELQDSVQIWGDVPLTPPKAAQRRVTIGSHRPPPPPRPVLGKHRKIKNS